MSSKILVAVSDPEIQQNLKAQLKDLGFSPSLSRPSEVGETARSLQPQVVLLDFNPEALLWLQNNQDKPATILVTDSPQNDWAPWFEAGLQEILSLPWSPQVLKARIKSALACLALGRHELETLAGLELLRKSLQQRQPDPALRKLGAGWADLAHLLDQVNLQPKSPEAAYPKAVERSGDARILVVDTAVGRSLTLFGRRGRRPSSIPETWDLLLSKT